MYEDSIMIPVKKVIVPNIIVESILHVIIRRGEFFFVYFSPQKINMEQMMRAIHMPNFSV